MAQSVIGALRIDLGINSAQFQTALKGAQKDVNAFAARARAAFASAGEHLKRFGMLAAAVLGGTVIATVKAATAAAGDIDDAAQRIGISAEKFQELAYAAKLAGVEQKDFATAMEQLSRRLGEIKVKGTVAEKTLSRIGIELDDIKGLSADKVIDRIADGLSKLKDPMERNAILAELFGGAGIKMAIMLKDGAAGIAGLAKEARALGFIISNDAIEKAAKAGDEFDRMGLVSRAAGIQISSSFLPALQSIREVMTSQGFQNGIKTVAENVGVLVKWLVDNRAEIVASTTAIVTFLKVTSMSKSPFVGFVAGAAVGIGVLEGMRSELDKAERELQRLEGSAKRLRETLTSLPPSAGAMPDVKDNLLKTEYQIAQTEERIKKLRAEIAKQPTDPAQGPAGDQAIRPNKEINDLLDDTIFKARLAGGEFRNFAPGFVEAARAAGLFGTRFHPIVTAVDQLEGKMVDVNREFQRIADNKRWQDIGKGIGDALGGAFESAVIEAKSFQEVLQSLYKDLLRLMMRKFITEPLANFFGGFLPTMIPGRAMGGPVMAGGMYEVGERGRELFVPRVDGDIIPHSQLGKVGRRGGGFTYAPVIDARGADAAAVARIENVLDSHSKQIKAQSRAMASAGHEQRFGVQL